MPPTAPSASNTVARRPPRASTQAEVSPAGPAPRTAAPTSLLSLPRPSGKPRSLLPPLGVRGPPSGGIARDPGSDRLAREAGGGGDLGQRQVAGEARTVAVERAAARSQRT